MTYTCIEFDKVKIEKSSLDALIVDVVPVCK